MPKSRPPADRFWEKVSRLKSGKKTNGQFCWVWTAGTNKQGYGLFNRGTRPAVGILAHRLSWEYANGDPGSKCVLHECDNPPCVNPAHLFTGTRTDNAADKVKKGRQKGPRGEEHPKSRLTPELVREIRAAYLTCSNRSELHRRYKDRIGFTAMRAVLDRKTWKGAEYEPVS